MFRWEARWGGRSLFACWLDRHVSRRRSNTLETWACLDCGLVARRDGDDGDMGYVCTFVSDFAAAQMHGDDD